MDINLENKKLSKNNFSIRIAIILLLTFFSISAKNYNPNNYQQKLWEASWISVSETNGTNYGVYLFRKNFELSKVPNSFPIYVSADNKYKLYVNGQLVSLGPAKGDVKHWFYEKVELAPYLQKGSNIIAAKVWNEGEFRQEAQISFNTGFIVQGTTLESHILNTNESWKSIQDFSYQPIVVRGYSSDPNIVKVPGYYVAGPGEKIEFSKQIRGWEKLSFNDIDWKNAKSISPGIPKNTIGLDAGNSWRLVPSFLPPMELKYQRFNKVRKSVGVRVPSSFPLQKSSFEIPANTSATVLLDQTFLTNAYPTLIFSGGNNSTISITYAEALYNEKFEKGNRDEIEGKNIIGRKDILISDGTKEQSFTSLSYRTYRYLEVHIETANSPITINDLYGTFVGYPFELKAKLDIDIPEVDKMMEIGWRTARLCALDTYMDCPYWEQLQYIGDTRIQAMVSIYNSGDDRLLKNALNLIDNSRQIEGVTLSRYPTINSQIIPTFSLWYLGMLHDYMMYGGDIDFVKNKLYGEREILNYFEKFQEADGSLKNLPNWFFTDWVNEWDRGMAPLGKNGNSALLDLQLLLAYQNAANIEQQIGMQEFTAIYNDKAKQLSETIKNKYWDNSRKLFADTKEKDKFSQHTNALAILAGLVSGNEAKDLGVHILNEPTLAQASIYFKYYVHQALVKAGLGNNYLNWLDIWRKNIELGLTTWGESSNVGETRSDCHAWGSSPNIEFFRTIIGLDSASPNFKSVIIKPHLGSIKEISGKIPHHQGMISIKYDLIQKKEAEIILPKNVTGKFIWKNTTHLLTGGKNIVKL